MSNTTDAWGESFDRVFEEELDCVRQRGRTVYGDTPSEGEEERRIASELPSTDNQLVGLAFSGGGIRSATINMGIAQALHRRGVFDHVDYMSTVSGGGYLGSSISTAMRTWEPGGRGEFPYEHQGPEARSAATGAGDPREVETRFLTWVRNNSNYLATGGFLDWPRIFGVLLRGMLANFLVLLPILLVFAVGMIWIHGDRLADWEALDLALTEARTHAAASAAAAEQAERRAVGGNAAAWAKADQARKRAEQTAEEARVLATQSPGVGGFFRLAILCSGLFLLLVLIYPAFVRVYRAFKHEEVVETGEESSVASRGLVEIAFALVLVAIAVAAALEALPLLIRWFHRFEASGFRGLWAGAGSGGALAIFASAGRMLSKLGGARQKVGLLMVGLLGLVIPLVVALYVADDLLYPVTLVEPGVTATPFYLTSALQPMEFTNPFGETGPVRLLPGILLLIIFGSLGAAAVGKLLRESLLRTLLTFVGVAIGALVGYVVLIGASQLLAFFGEPMGLDGIRPDFLVLAMALIIFVFCWAAVDVNLTSVLGLYRDRLAAAYLIGVRKRRNERGEETAEEEIFVEPDLNLEELCGGPAADRRPSKAPYHILNTALNLQGSRDPLLRDRGSDFFMFSKLYYGGHRTGYCPTGLLETVFPQMDLPTAMAISAAAGIVFGLLPALR
ncbi:MAG: hypothetical protein ACE5EG_05720, partial [Thermoanaerobaculia bacterium]